MLPSIPARLAYSIPETAELLSLSRTKVLALTKIGFIRATDFGRRRLILREEIERVLAGVADGTLKVPKAPLPDAEKKALRLGMREYRTTKRAAMKAQAAP